MVLEKPNTYRMELNKVHNIDFLNNDLPDKCARLIIADPPYYKVKGDFDFIWKTFDDYLADVEKWAIECKRILADNGTLFWYGGSKNIAYAQIIFDKHFNLINNLTWNKGSFMGLEESQGLRSFAPCTERILMYEKTGQKTAPFGVNLIVHPTNIRVKADLDICKKHKVPLVITSLGAISGLVDEVHGYGGLVYHDIIKKRHAEKAAQAGVDGLIVVAAGAGGHAGTLHPIPLINEVRKVFDKKIILSGCLSTGNDIASALQMGADIAYMGTRFINVKESMAHDDYKKMILESSAEDIVYTAAVSGVNANFLRPSLEAMGITEEQWKESKTQLTQREKTQ
mgnify:CR=1 FL=1